MGWLAGYATRATLGAIVVLISLVGGRIVPSFTRNWLARERPGGRRQQAVDALGRLTWRRSRCDKAGDHLVRCAQIG
jgi:uncharacterized protein involved in response to NO